MIDHFLHVRPNGTDRRLTLLEDLTEQYRGNRELLQLDALVGKAYGELHLRAEERADYSPEIVRRRVGKIRDELVPLARELVGVPAR